MSMYQIEDLVEASVNQLCQVAIDPYQLWNDIHYLYEFQDQFDCSFTHFRVLQELLDCGFMIPLEPCEHPLYIQDKESFNRLVQEDFAYLPRPSGGYWCGVIEGKDGEKFVLNKLFCDYGSPLWQQLVESGRLSGETARPLLALNPYELVLRIVRQVSSGEDPFLFYHWYSLFPMLVELTENTGEISDEVKVELNDRLCRPEVFRALKEDAHMAPQEDDYLDEEFPGEWFAPYFKWCDTVDNDPEYLARQIMELFTKGDFRAAWELSAKGLQLSPDDAFFSLFWATSLVILQAREIIPFKLEDNRKAVRVFERFLEYRQDEAKVWNINFYLAMACLPAREFGAAEEAIAKVTDLFDQYPKLLDDYRDLEKKWREKTDS